ncbi:MAG: sialidase family protein [Solirubrobacteraceae bacterium]
MSISRRTFRLGAAVGSLAAGAALAIAGPALGNVPLNQISSDPFGNTTSQHATEVEPDTFASASTVVTAFQVGRFVSGGATDIGFGRSTDGGATWGAAGFLPGLTATSGHPGTTGGSYERVSDASVAFDALHKVWLISSIPLTFNTLVVPTVFISRSTDGGATFGDPVSIPPPVANKVDLDKNWTVCDNTASSRFYGHCYTEFDNFGQGDLEYMSTSIDGGQTWSSPVSTAGNDKGLGGQPLVQPNGTVIVPFESLNGKEAAFKSTDGGATWTRAVTISSIRFAQVGGGLRTSPLPSAEIDGAGKVYVAWEDCRFRKNCTSNDIVLSSSTDGVNWSPVTRVPIDSVTSGADHFIPGLAVDKGTSGATAHLALTYYFYPDATCTGGCRLTVGYISSPDGGGHWGDPLQLTGPMSLSDIANTSQGPMVGDYISTSFSSRGTTAPVIAIGKAHTVADPFDEAIYAPATPLGVTPLAAAHQVASSAGAQTTTGTGTGTAHQAIRDN